MADYAKMTNAQRLARLAARRQYDADGAAEEEAENVVVAGGVVLVRRILTAPGRMVP